MKKPEKPTECWVSWCSTCGVFLFARPDQDEGARILSGKHCVYDDIKEIHAVLGKPHDTKMKLNPVTMEYEKR